MKIWVKLLWILNKSEKTLRFINIRIPEWIYEFIPISRRRVGRRRKRCGYQRQWGRNKPMSNDKAGRKVNGGNFMLHLGKYTVNLCCGERKWIIWKKESRWISPTTARSNNKGDNAMQTYRPRWNDIHIAKWHLYFSEFWELKLWSYIGYYSCEGVVFYVGVWRTT
jgi:hypothetical protein